jgi:ribonuclease HII
MENKANQFVKYEAGIDEAGRGTLCGRVYTAAVVLPEETEFPDDTYLKIKDSKKCSKKLRETLRNYIETNAIAYSVAYSEVEEIDAINILQATMNAMHRALDGLKVVPEALAVDGSYFKTYIDRNGDFVPHTLVTGGDNRYRNIAAASILAKTYHDEHIRQILYDDPEMEKYGWEKNMGYGTKAHLEAIKIHGVSKYHRRSFGPCK